MGRKGDVMKVLFAFVCSCCLTISLIAQGEASVSGRVTRGGQPVDRSMVYLKDRYGIVNLQTETDAAGEYSFGPLTPGDYSLWTSVVIEGITEFSDRIPSITISPGTQIQIDLQVRPGISE